MADLGSNGYTPDPAWKTNDALLVGSITTYISGLRITTPVALNSNLSFGVLTTASSTGTGSSGGGLITHPGMGGGMRG